MRYANLSDARLREAVGSLTHLHASATLSATNLARSSPGNEKPEVCVTLRLLSESSGGRYWT